MKSKERLRLAIEHKETDRVPIDLGGSGLTSIAAIPYNKILNKLGIKNTLPRISDFMCQLAYLDEAILEHFNIDVIDPGQFFLKDRSNWREYTIPFDGTKCLIPKYLDNLYDIKIDKDGTVSIHSKDGILFGIMPKSSRVVDQEYWPWGDLEKIPEEIDSDWKDKHLWFIPKPMQLTEMFNEKGEELVKNVFKKSSKMSDRAVLYSMGGNVFDIGFTLRKLDNFLCDVYQDTKGVERLSLQLFEDNMKSIEKVSKEEIKRKHQKICRY